MLCNKLLVDIIFHGSYIFFKFSYEFQWYSKLEKIASKENKLKPGWTCLHLTVNSSHICSLPGISVKLSSCMLKTALKKNLHCMRNGLSLPTKLGESWEHHRILQVAQEYKRFGLLSFRCFLNFFFFFFCINSCCKAISLHLFDVTIFPFNFCFLFH